MCVSGVLYDFQVLLQIFQRLIRTRNDVQFGFYDVHELWFLWFTHMISNQLQWLPSVIAVFSIWYYTYIYALRRVVCDYQWFARHLHGLQWLVYASYRYPNKYSLCLTINLVYYNECYHSCWWIRALSNTPSIVINDSHHISVIYDEVLNLAMIV